MDEVPREIADLADLLDRGGGAVHLDWADIAAWHGAPVPPRKWAIRDRVPLRQVGLFSGAGGAGKSIIELQKAVAHVAGTDWLGSLPERGPAFYVGTEDEEDEVHRRLADITAHYELTFGDLAAGGLHVLCLLGKDATLCGMTRNGRIEPTGLYHSLYEAAGDLKPKSIGVDTLSRAFGGNELDRAQVYAFAMHMQALAKVADGSVTVLSHPSLAGMANGSGISGSTAWHGAFRFRQYLTSAEDGDQDGENTDLRELRFLKNQYGPLGETVTLRYQGGLFLPLPGTTGLDRMARQSAADRIFLDLLRRFTAQGRNVSDKTGTSYAPALFAREAEAAQIRLRSAELADAMRRLFAADVIAVETYGRPSRPYTRLGIKP